MNFKKRFFMGALLLSFTLILSCKIGMGSEIDLEAPVIEITSPEKFSYEGLQFDITGTCSDNIKVTDVIISNTVTGKIYGRADIVNDTWSFHVNLDKNEEGEITFLCEAQDARKNSSIRSARNITLLVDEHAPEGLSWYVDRGNSIQTPLKEKNFLEELDLTQAVNKNYPQNEKFTVYSSFYDAMSIDTITLKLFDDEVSTVTPVITKTVNSNPENTNYIGEGKSIYSPSFTFTHDELVAAQSSYKSGKHYLRVGYYAKDNDSLENFNDAEVDTGLYILWYPESDNPGTGIQDSQIKHNEDGKVSISISVGSDIHIDFFDDDGLKETYCAIRKNIPTDIESYTKQLVSSTSVRASAFDYASYDSNYETGASHTFSNNVTTDYPTDISAPEFPGQMYLITCAKDVNNNWSARVIETDVTDSEKPLLFIEAPSENTIPEMENNKFKIYGYSLDKKGSSFIKICYIPETRSRSSSDSKDLRARELFYTYENDTREKIVIPETGEVIWYQPFTVTENFNGWKKEKFSFTFDLLNDFKNAAGETTAKDSKFFEILLMDTDNNPVYKTFILSGDSTSPTIEISKPAKELEVHDYTQNDLEIIFKGTKKSNLGMDTSKYKVTTKIGDDLKEFTVGNGITLSGETASIKITKTTLTEWSKTESQPTFTFYATDVLGNGGKGEGQRSVILSPRPVINSITVDKNDGTYKKDDILKFKVSFSKQVKVSGSPKLVLKFSTSDTTPKYATYEGGSGSNVLTFSYTVNNGDETQKLICEGFDTESENVLKDSCTIRATELGEGEIYTSIAKAEVLKGKIIKLDGISPKINKISITPVDGIAACTTDKEIKAVVETTENVLVSGNPTLVLNAGSGTKNITFTFQKMSGKEITFVHTVKKTDVQGKLTYSTKDSFTAKDAGYIKDEAGNILDISGTNKTGDSVVIIDYTAPEKAPTVDFTKSLYNDAQDISLSDIDENAIAYYSKDGGVSWTVYDSEHKETIGNGTYKIVTKQADAAGNMSKNSATTTVTINSNFAPVTGFNVDISDGFYPAGTEFTFSLNFDDNVIIENPTDVKLVFESIGNSSITREVKVNVPEGNKTSKLTFNYKVTDNDFIDGLKVTSITFADSVKDEYGNKPAYSKTAKQLTPDNCDFIKNSDGGNRAGISLDGIKPSLIIDECIPVNGGISTNTATSNCNITLKFSEKVYKEEGEIILRRKGDWAIPAVFGAMEFRNLYNKMTTENRNKMMLLETGSTNELLDSKTAQPVGPYKKITQGLKQSGDKLIPDTATKYVLDFQYDLYTGDTVSAIRDALKSIDYDKHSIDVNASGVKLTYNDDGTTSVNIQFPEAIENGREWELVIPEKAFRDNAENFYPGMNIEGADDTYSLWSNRVATPVVRIDRYSHGWGAQEPKTNAEKTQWSLQEITTNDQKFSNTKTDTSGRSIEPTGYIRARIDCETPDVAITYITHNSGSAEAGASLTETLSFATATNNLANCSGKISTIADATKTALETSTGSKNYTANSYIYLGDGSYLTARKDYVSAKATKTGFVTSSYGYEGAFKTVIYSKVGSSAKNYINIEGCTAPGGEPSVSGFPLRDGTDKSDTNASRYSKNAYIISDTDSVWVSYEIVSTEFSILLCRSNHASSYALGNYGQCMYITGITWEANG